MGDLSRVRQETRIPWHVPMDRRCHLFGAWWVGNPFLVLRWPDETEPQIGELVTPDEADWALERHVEQDLRVVELELAVDNHPAWLQIGGHVVLDWIGPCAVNRRLLEIVAQACRNDHRWRAEPRWDGCVSAWVGDEPRAFFAADSTGGLVQPVRPAREA